MSDSAIGAGVILIFSGVVIRTEGADVFAAVVGRPVEGVVVIVVGIYINKLFVYFCTVSIGICV